jgi:isoquinoline 1-oxidoreductase subunit alpha
MLPENPSEEPPVKLKVNGKERSVEAPEDMPLLWVLRDLLDLTGTKYGCGESLCGACTVHIDGKPERACVVTAGSAVGRSITTIEGLSPDGQHPVQRAWAELDVVQCGYCQTGQIMSAAALLSSRPRPTDGDIDAAMKGNICRCGTYERIRAAIARAAELAGGKG